MSDLVDFLLARIGEDEADARVHRIDELDWSWSRAHEIGPAFGAICEASDLGELPFPHIARWSPARALAECDAKRRIIEDHQFALITETPLVEACYRCSNWDSTGLSEYHEIFPCPTIRLLAFPYADHPDYDESWRP